MGVSILIVAGIMMSLMLGALALAAAFWLAQKMQPDRRWSAWLGGSAIASLVNVWWVVLLGIIFVKFVVLGEDT